LHDPNEWDRQSQVRKNSLINQKRGGRKTEVVNPVRNSSGALNPAGIIIKSKPAAAAGPEGLWPGGSSGTLFLTG